MKYNLNIIFWFVIASCFCVPTLRAQEDGDFRDKEFIIHGGFGLSALSYSPTIGKLENGFGGQFGVSYRLGLSMYSSTWSLLMGTEVAFYKASFSLDNLETFSDVRYIDAGIPNVTGSFQFQNTITTYKETQSTMLLQIPLMLQFQTENHNSLDFYFAFGGKFGLPLSGKSKSSATSVKNVGDMKYYNATPDEQRFMGFDTFGDVERENKLDFNMAVLASVETGLKLTFDAMSLYLGIYLDYGLTNIQPKDQKSFIQYNPDNPRDFFVNSVTESTFMQNNTSSPITEKIIPMTIGFKVKLGF